MRRRLRFSIRLRLTALYGALFLGAGAVLLVVNYALVRGHLPPKIKLVGPAPSVAPTPTATTVTPLPFGAHPENSTSDDIDRIARVFRDQALHQLVVQSGVALAIMVLLSVLLGWAVAGRVLRPVHEITATARRLSERNLHERINLAGPADELKELADTFDEVLARLESAFDAQGRFVANASHELRTPLSIMRAELDVAAADPTFDRDRLLSVTGTLRTVIAREEAVIEGLLTLAHSTREIAVREPVDLAAVAEVAMAEAEADMSGLGLHLDADLQPARVVGDGNLLEHLAGNLVTNAARHNVEGGWLWVATRSKDGRAELEVANGGTAIPADAVDALFEPFRRLVYERGSSYRGAGLGLSIVRAVTEAHGGIVTIKPRSNGGITVLVSLPSA